MPYILLGPPSIVGLRTDINEILEWLKKLRWCSSGSSGFSVHVSGAAHSEIQNRKPQGQPGNIIRDGETRIA